MVFKMDSRGFKGRVGTTEYLTGKLLKTKN